MGHADSFRERTGTFDASEHPELTTTSLFKSKLRCGDIVRNNRQCLQSVQVMSKKP
jgi:hypothetical protein